MTKSSRFLGAFLRKPQDHSKAVLAMGQVIAKVGDMLFLLSAHKRKPTLWFLEKTLPSYAGKWTIANCPNSDS
ncbi:hypothetical protein EHQ58_04340 [Leptospira ognonensis]|uniref:Uncharacterized protein n=1 Tax=Leptospira ognonensis TaxID=2484945 RepID=A0A4R9K6F8_9LEPT|nr:hypothetical protein [Leptospira ognonensis]TGL61849.1 hypothetical protein EHQ58_04340 [Leptospira ognonensis]